MLGKVNKYSGPQGIIWLDYQFQRQPASGLMTSKSIKIATLFRYCQSSNPPERLVGNIA